MKLAIFDIDGTLTLGDGLGTRCFFGVLEALFPGPAAERRLEAYGGSTDGEILGEALRRRLGRAAAEAEVEAFKGRYLEELAAAVGSRPRAYRPVPGATDVGERLRAVGGDGWMMAVATGNWRGAAGLKLESAGIVVPPVAACAEDGRTRAEVVGWAVAAARSRAGADFETVVYVGDQPWDLAAAREAGVGFVGVDAAGRATALRGSGVPVVGGLRDADGLREALALAAGSFRPRPVPPSGPGRSAGDRG